MRFDILTLFPEMCRSVLQESILGRGQACGAFSAAVHDIRDYADNKHRRVDDYPYGGGMGMVMQIQPVAAALRAVTEGRTERPRVVYLSPKGRVFNQQIAREYAALDGLVLLCGHYEGIDQRIIDRYVDEELSVGDFVLTGGELPALTVVDAVARMLPGVLSADECFEEESIYSGLLEYPQYTRPPVYEDMPVPEVLISGNHGEIAKWRRKEALRITAERRPDLLKEAELTGKDREFLEQLSAGNAAEEKL